ncbi:MAG TPA: hypothetical protein VHP11_11435 [Tepidisphaeraceae bacterium]|nr:hypothetical protein [Tepidisphaeraceae bacterium]
MSCWVVPAVAAEYWGIPITQVLERAKSGAVASKTEFGFMLVDVAPNSPRAETGFRPPAANPPTYVKASDELTAEEEFALADAKPAREEPSEEPADPELVTETTDLDETFDWREARRAAGRQRRAPRATPLAA